MARTKRARRRVRRARATVRRPRRAARKVARRRARNARGWFTSRGAKTYGRRGKVRRFRRGKKRYTRPVRKSTLRARARSRSRRPSRRPRTRRNPPQGRAIFGLEQLARIPLIGPLFREDVIYTGVGVATGLALIPKFEGMILKATGVAPDPATGTAGAEWYTKLDAKGNLPIGRRVMDTALPVAVGSAGAMAAWAVRGSGAMARFTRNFSKGVAIAGVGIGIGRLLDWLLWPNVPEAIRPPIMPGVTPTAMTVPPPQLLDYAQASILPRSLSDYAQASGLPRSLNDYATAGTGFDDYAQASDLPTSLGHHGGMGQGNAGNAFGAQDRRRGESLLEGGGEEAELATMTAEMRTF